MRIAQVFGLVLGGLLIPLCASAQASFYFSNGQSAIGEINAPVFDWLGMPLEGPSWRAELYGGATQSSLSPVLDYYDRSRGIATFWRPGFFFSDKAFLSVMSVPPNGSAWLEVRVWNADLGATYEDVVTRGLGGYGYSSLFLAQGGNPLDTLAPPSPLTGLTSFSVSQVIPEPAVAWLLLLALPFLLLGRRRTLRRRTDLRGRVFYES